jgi:hypothetical protein
MWEIFSFGSHPYQGIDNNRVHLNLTKGVRLERPEGCSTDAYKVMHTCWKMDPDVSQQDRTLLSRVVGLVVLPVSTWLI